MNLRTGWFFAFAVIVASLNFSAHAGLVSPGESVTMQAADFDQPQGLLVAEGSVAFKVHYAGVSEPIDGQLIDSVLQDPFTNELTFIYNVILTPASGPEGTARSAALSANGFAGLVTDLTGYLLPQNGGVLSRSADGATVDIHNIADGQGGSPLLVVKTNATEFDSKGSASFSASDNFPISDALTAAQVASGKVDIDGAFRPISRAAEVPLPPAVYSATGVLLAIGLMTITRRRFALPA